MRTRRLGLIGVAALAVVAFAPTMFAASTTVFVRPTAAPNVFTQGWFGYPDRPTAAGSSQIGTAPGTQTLGSGSLEMSNTAFGWEVAAYGNPAIPAGTPLSAVQALSYATYTASGQSGITVQHVALQFTVDFDLTDNSQQFQGRLVFEPYHCNTVGFDAWSTWNTLASANTGCWWQTSSSPRVDDVIVPVACPQSNPCTWQEVMGAYADAGFHSTNGATGLIFKVGSTWTGTFHTDALVVGLGGNMTTYDFEPLLPQPASKDDCKKGGWANLSPDGNSSFKNQGDCIQYANTNK